MTVILKFLKRKEGTEEGEKEGGKKKRGKKKEEQNSKYSTQGSNLMFASWLIALSCIF